MTTHKDQIIQLHKSGKTYSQIAEILGCSKGTIAYHVGAGQKEKAHARTRDRRSRIRKYIQEYKQSKICMDCKEDYPYYMLEFDHRPDENKRFNISSGPVTASIDDIVKEISKCDVVCANCHKIRTHQRLVESNAGVLYLSEMY